MPPRPVASSEIQKCYQIGPKFNDIYSRNNLPKINDESYIINLDECKSIRFHWTALYAIGDNAAYFCSSRV